MTRSMGTLLVLRLAARLLGGGGRRGSGKGLCRRILPYPRGRVGCEVTASRQPESMTLRGSGRRITHSSRQDSRPGRRCYTFVTPRQSAGQA
eukprot:576025-Prorocentrum_minimum.AAC.1